jgi:hypothetical protein
MPLISFHLFHLRMIPVPTVAGILFFTLIGCGSLLAVVYALPSFLAVNNPVRHGLLVVEGWVSLPSLRMAADTFQQGGYEAIVVSGGPIEGNFCRSGFDTYAERAAYELKQLGIADSRLIVAPAPASAQDRTYRSSVSVRQLLESQGRKVTAFDLFSSGPHTRRSRNLYQLAFGEHVKVGAIAAPPSTYDFSHWWRSSAGVKEVLAEGIAYAWTLCCFEPGKPGSWEEAWGNGRK